MKNNNISPKLKITCIIHSLGLGGMERVMASLLNSFANRDNVEVSLLLIGRSRTVEFDISNKIKVHTPNFEFNPQKRNVSTLRTMLFIRKTIKEINPYTILSFGEFWNNLVLLSLRGLKYPVYISDRSQPNKNLGRVQNLLRNTQYPKAAGYIAQTEKAMEIASEKKWNSNIAVIGNPIREIEIQNDQQKENIVLTVGRLIKTKHIDRLIEMFGKCNFENWELIIVGGNAKKMNLLEEYRTLVKKMGMENRIKLVGTQKNVDEYYRKSKIFAFTSSSEGFPNVLGEAMAAGRAVISFDCVAGPSDLIDDGVNGFLIPENDHEQYIEKLKLLMSNQDLREKLGKAAREKIKEFEVSKIAQRYYDFITQK